MPIEEADSAIGEISPGPSVPAPRRASAQRAPRRLIVVSNRVGPIGRERPAQGGLAVALRAALERAGGIWFGYSGSVSERPSGSPKLSQDGDITAAVLDLSRRDFEEYYIGYANRVLWPLFHYRASLIGFSRRDLAGYLRVNRSFARALAPMLQPDDLVWVHDYHLIPLGEALRQLDCHQPIGFFLHTPFPAAEMLRIVPNHRELAAALCAYDLVGFQTAADFEGFRDYLLRHAGGQDLGGGRLRAFGRIVQAGAFPIGIDVAAVTAHAEAAEESRQMRRLTGSIRDRSLIIGVDRIDYSKGLPARFAAYSHLLEHYPQTRGRTVLMQIASPSRSDVPEYRAIRRELEAAAGHINGRYAEFDWTPVRYLNKSFNHRILSGFYRTARIGLVTPFRDGMNLVAKEYVAAQRPDDPGVLVLSCFAGAVRELAEAIIVNPFDLEAMAEAIWQGLQMPLEERCERWAAMMQTLRRNDINAWREHFLAALANAGSGQ
ncbi:MAG: trehalose-6-phosphate synthase [Alphaproteobacteria bacterium]|nr:trehalose-6-phosphate synthase [Alphaproteobacteria bacterium]MBV9150560.1 trehalose-6-phosphate synthase [Alphaproteobacteria bacterium]MBV9587533.1 trehalose-6-phosphate synthase [Alphaproteobacteria bacterium]MBV9966395.1 trehalose-6-phosphate synthase [Alphaproteobacteria bacterium]